MYRPSEIDLLTAWERSYTSPQQANGPLLLLATLFPDESMESLEQITIGQRDAYLLQLREQLFGSSISGVSDCIGCGEALEIHLDLRALKLQPVESTTPKVIDISKDEFEVSIRLPNCLDMLEISRCKDAEMAKIELLGRIMLSSTLHGAPASVSELPGDIVELIDSALNSADSQANIQLNLGCVACGKVNQVLFDIGSLLCKEIDAWAVRLLRDVHELALSYGWNEAEILNMKPWRRRCYLEMVRA